MGLDFDRGFDGGGRLTRPFFGAVRLSRRYWHVAVPVYVPR